MCQTLVQEGKDKLISKIHLVFISKIGKKALSINKHCLINWKNQKYIDIDYLCFIHLLNTFICTYSLKSKYPGPKKNLLNSNLIYRKLWSEFHMPTIMNRCILVVSLPQVKIMHCEIKKIGKKNKDLYGLVKSISQKMQTT